MTAEEVIFCEFKIFDDEDIFDMEGFPPFYRKKDGDYGYEWEGIVYLHICELSCF